MTRRTNPTIDDLARRLGVHKSTVSRAMDPARRSMVSAELLQRVETAARELGYHPNRTAAALSTGRTRTIGVLLPDITNPVFPPILKGIEDALDAEGYFALVANTRRGERAAETAVARLQAQRVEGFLIASASKNDSWIEDLRKAGTPIVLVNRGDDARLPAVISDDAFGMKLAVNHLVELGHKHIAHLAGPAVFSTGRARRLGFKQALAAHGLSAAGIVECNAYSIEAGRIAMATLLDEGGRNRRRLRFTGLIAANDLIALGAIQVLRERRISIPEDVSVIGHNDMPFLDHMTPALTSVRIHHYELGYRAARLLLDIRRGLPGSSDASIVLRPVLVIRHSTAPPRTRRSVTIRR